ncbi:MAG TPA: Rieske (2Fe-2S) protein [Rhodopila sp.]|uniref:QcrA and Rieske domain-containing protein n=1 Tax=Rhodopila sp. TaxID=2480087 RepID=UPI002BB4A4CD|nr:Rieske (2Fe-2S) protein [Rhodopila sp.]HVY15972.1 Rieske (2Fe-2S) protein [Rhodopila sp.]
MDPATGALRDQNRLNQILILSLDSHGATPAKVVAFSAICTHAGCLVSNWIALTHHLRCPCHGSEYDPANGGVVVAGPAPQPLPSLPVAASNGVITIAGPFSAAPGGHTSRTT